MSSPALTARSLMMHFIVGARLRIAGAVAAGVLTILSSVCLLAVSAYLIERASQRPPILSLEVAIVSVRFFGISRGIFRYLDRYLSHDASFRLLGDIRADIYRRLIPLAPAGLDTFGRGDVFARVAADVDTMQEWFVRGFAPLATTIVTAVVLILAAAIILPTAGLALMLALTGAALAILLVAGSGGESEACELELRGELTSKTVEYIHGIADLTAMGAAVRMAARIEDLENRRAGLTAARSRRNAFAAAVQSALPGLVAALLGAVAIAALAGGLNPLQVGVLVFGGMGAAECVMAVSPAIAAWERGHAAAARLAGLSSLDLSTSFRG
jgi:ABC-type transport system involved in cytochrome bd biosynthesis fused ATPase/permease subunit